MATFTATILAMCRDGQDFSVRQLALLGVIAKAKKPEERTIRALAVTLDISKPATTRGADVLVAWKFAKRVLDPNDARSVFVEITDAGRAYATRINNGWTE